MKVLQLQVPWLTFLDSCVLFIPDTLLLSVEIHRCLIIRHFVLIHRVKTCSNQRISNIFETDELCSSLIQASIETPSMFLQVESRRRLMTTTCSSRYLVLLAALSSRSESCAKRPRQLERTLLFVMELFLLSKTLFR